LSEDVTRRLQGLVGEWDMEAFGGHASVRFEWLSGETFLVQRWEIPEAPEAPDGSGWELDFPLVYRKVAEAS
jgi:hypothetical protein